MGANDAAEMLEVAKAECARLERDLAVALAEVKRLVNLQAAAQQPNPTERPDDSEADAAIADAEDLNEALWEIAEKYQVPVTNNYPRWQEGQWLREIGEFIGDIRNAVERFTLPIPATGEAEYTVGMVNSDGSVSADDDDTVTGDIEEAREWVQEAIAGGTFSNAVLVSRPVSKWEVTP